MNIDLSEEQRMIVDSARRFLQKECPPDFVREMARDAKGITPELWRGMAELGWMGLVVPEQYGGFEGNFLDLILLLEEMGRVTLPGPFFSHVLLGEMCLLAAGDEAQKERYLPPLSLGEAKITLALNEVDSIYHPASISTIAKMQGDSAVLTGRKLYVPDAGVADFIICVARSEGSRAEAGDGLGAFVLHKDDAGISLRRLEALAGDKQYEMILEGVTVPAERILGEIGEVWSWLHPVLLKAALAKCAEMVGSGQRVLQLAVDYSKEREQFGQFIGSFQAIQHHCVNMLVELETCRWLVYRTAWMMDEQMPCQAQCSMAKAWCGDAYRRLVNLGHQVMGGIGYAEEHELPLHFRRSRLAEPTLGGLDYHRRQVAVQLLG
ncbi:MAG: acyl-CoA dehydrogenase family protein [Pseudomonadota bacterium]